MAEQPLDDGAPPDEAFLSNDFVCAALGGELDVVRTALDAGQSIEAVDYDGSTALCAAAYGGQTEIVSFLLSRGADVNAANAANGFTPVIAATYTVSVGALRVLLNATPRGGRAPDLLLEDHAGKSASTYALENIAQGKLASGFVCLQHFLSVDEEPLRESFEPGDGGTSAYDAAHAAWEVETLSPRGEGEALEDFDRRREAWLHTILVKHPWDEAAALAAPPSCLAAYLLPLSEFSAGAQAIGEAIAAKLKVPLADAVREGSFVAALQAQEAAREAAVTAAAARAAEKAADEVRAVEAARAAEAERRRVEAERAAAADAERRKVEAARAAAAAEAERIATEAARRVEAERAASEAARRAALLLQEEIAAASAAAAAEAAAAAAAEVREAKAAAEATVATPLAAAPEKKGDEGVNGASANLSRAAAAASAEAQKAKAVIEGAGGGAGAMPREGGGSPPPPQAAAVAAVAAAAAAALPTATLPAPVSAIAPPPPTVAAAAAVAAPPPPITKPVATGDTRPRITPRATTAAAAPAPTDASPLARSTPAVPTTPLSRAMNLLVPLSYIVALLLAWAWGSRLNDVND